LRATGDDDIAVLITKTAAGKRELQERTIALKRSSRTLLVLADGLRTQEELLQFVRGAEPSDIEELRAAGLVTLSQVTVSVARRTEGANVAGQAPRGPSARTSGFSETSAPEAWKPAQEMSYQEIYATLNLLCRDHLGLIKGFRYSMEIEKASGIEELKAVARRFAAEVEQSKGPVAGQLVRRALAIGD
jgi:hypothetical protein